MTPLTHIWVELRHQNLCEVKAFDEHKSGGGGLPLHRTSFFFDYLEISLEDVMNERKKQSLRFPEEDLLRIMREVLECLQYMQSQGEFIGVVSPTTLFHDSVDNCIKMYDTSAIFGQSNNLPASISGYRTPEGINTWNRHESEIFQLGLTMLEIASFQDSASLSDNSRINLEEIQRRIDSLKGLYSLHIQSILRNMLTTDSRQRPTASMLLAQLLSEGVHPSTIIRQKAYAITNKPTLPLLQLPVQTVLAARNITFAADSSSGRGTPGRSLSPLQLHRITAATAYAGSGGYIVSPQNSFREVHSYVTPRQGGAPVVTATTSPANSSPFGQRSIVPPSFNQLDLMIHQALLAKNRVASNEKSSHHNGTNMSSGEGNNASQVHSFLKRDSGGGGGGGCESKQGATPSPAKIQPFFGRLPLTQLQTVKPITSINFKNIHQQQSSLCAPQLSFASLLKKRKEFSNRCNISVGKGDCADDVRESLSDSVPPAKQLGECQNRIRLLAASNNHSLSQPQQLQVNRKVPSFSKASCMVKGQNNLPATVSPLFTPTKIISPSQAVRGSPHVSKLFFLNDQRTSAAFTSVPLTPIASHPSSTTSPFHHPNNKSNSSTQQLFNQLTVKQYPSFHCVQKTYQSKANLENVSPSQQQKVTALSHHSTSYIGNGASSAFFANAASEVKQLKKPVPKITLFASNVSSPPVTPGNRSHAVGQNSSYLQIPSRSCSPLALPPGQQIEQVATNFLRERSITSSQVKPLGGGGCSGGGYFNPSSFLQEQSSKPRPAVINEESESSRPSFRGSHLLQQLKPLDSFRQTPGFVQSTKNASCNGKFFYFPPPANSERGGHSQKLQRGADKRYNQYDEGSQQLLMSGGDYSHTLERCGSPTAYINSGQNLIAFPTSSSVKQRSETSQKLEDTQRKLPTDQLEQLQQSIFKIGDLDQRLEMIIQKNMQLTQIQ